VAPVFKSTRGACRSGRDADSASDGLYLAVLGPQTELSDIPEPELA
jgi:hypothetical protein